MKYKDLKEHLTTLKTVRSGIDDMWNEIERTFLSWIVDTTGTETKPMFNYDNYDTTGSECITTQSEGLMGSLTNSATDWFGTRFEEEKLNQNSMAKVWADELKDWFLRIFEKGNFYDALTTVYRHGAVYGIGYIYPTYSKGRIIYKTFNPKRVWINDDEDGEVCEMVIETIMDATKIRSEYGKIDIVEKADKMNTTRKWKVYITIVKNTNYREESFESKKYKSFHWIDDDSNTKTKTILRESGFDYFPVIAWRMYDLDGFSYGTGSCMLAYPDMKKLNGFERDLLDVSHLKTSPPIQIPPEYEGMDLDLTPSGYVYADPNRPIKPIQMVGDYPIGRDVVDRLKQNIRDIFKVDFFRVLQTLSERQMTATQVIQIAQEKASALGVLTSRIISNLLNPLFDIIFDIGIQYDMVPGVPFELAQMGFPLDKIKIDYNGVLAQMQKSFNLSNSIQQTFNSLAPLAQLNPEIFDNLDVDVIASEVTKNSRLPARAQRSASDIDRIRQERAAAAQAQQQRENLLATSDAYAKTSKAPESGSGAEEILNAGI